MPADGSDGLAILAARMQQWQTAPVPDLPPFQGGAAGLFSYDLSRSLERIAKPRYDEFQVPAMAIGFYDVVIATDHIARTNVDHLTRISRNGIDGGGGPGPGNAWPSFGNGSMLRKTRGRPARRLPDPAKSDRARQPGSPVRHAVVESA